MASWISRRGHPHQREPRGLVNPAIAARIVRPLKYEPGSHLSVPTIVRPITQRRWNAMRERMGLKVDDRLRACQPCQKRAAASCRSHHAALEALEPRELSADAMDELAPAKGLLLGLLLSAILWGTIGLTRMVALPLGARLRTARRRRVVCRTGI